MKLPPSSKLQLALLVSVACLGVASVLFFISSPAPASAQNPPPVRPPRTRVQTNSAADAAEAAPAAGVTNVVVATPVEGPVATNTPPAAPAPALVAASSGAPPGNSAVVPPPSAGVPAPEPDLTSSTNEIQLSFQAANIDMVVQWLAKATGKSVVKHPRVQCQLTIVSSKKLSPRDAINLVYRALALEGFTTVESSKSIIIVPEGQEPKMSPELVDAATKGVPDGRQRFIKIFPLKNIAPTELRDKIKSVLSEKSVVEVADRSNQIIITDYTENIRLVGELITELDVPSSSDVVIEFFTLKYAEAEEIGNLITLVINSQAAPPSAPSSSRPSPSSSSSRNISLPPGISMPSMPSPSSESSGGSAAAGASQAGQGVKIWTDKTANRLIVAAPKTKLPEVKRLIDLLDTEKPQDVTIRVLPLKNVSAEDLVRELGPLYQKLSGKSLKDAIEVTANTRANSLVVLSSEANFKTISKLIASLDTEEAQEKVMQAFTLKNADAEDVAKQLQELNQDQDSSSRFPYYIFSYGGGGGRASKKATFVADRRRNTVIVQSPPQGMDNIARMIKELDQPVSDQGLAPKIFRLKFVSATDIEDVLNELFLKKSQQRNYWDPYGFPARDTGGEQNSGRLTGKVRITSEPYSNSLIVTSNSAENLAAVEEVIHQLDAPSEAGETTLRVGLRFGKAVSLANNLNILFAKGGSPPLRQANQPQQTGDPRQQQQQQQQTQQGSFGLEQEVKEDIYFPWLGGQQENQRTTDGRSASRPVSDLVGRVRVVPDKRINSVLVTCNVHYFPQIIKLINEMDAPTAQVLIEAKIMEVSADFRDKLGVRWSPDGSRTFDASDMDNAVSIKGSAAYQKVFTGSTLANALKSGVLESSVNLDVLVQFLRKNTDSTVLAEPQINVADNEMGKLFVGSRVPFISGSLNTEIGGRNDTFQYKDVGIILEVTPHINDSEEVALRISAESSNIRPGETLFGGAILDTRNFRTDLSVKSGETVVLGGIIQRDLVDTVRKVPGLGSIPVLGWVFKKKDKVSREVELMVFLRPWVTRTPEQAKKLREEVEKRTPLIQRENANPSTSKDPDKAESKK